MRLSVAARTAVLALASAVLPSASQAGVVVSITVAPPVMPVYVQPVIPGEGYLWTPGYWAYGAEGYFWVPGVWMRPPQVGLLWTPGYWGFTGGVYGWNAGYWGPHVGFYGGVNYGFGFGGVGFVGGRWEGGHFAYNSAVANFGGVSIHNSYRETVVENNVHTSFNGGAGLRAQPTPGERSAMNEHHIDATKEQLAHHEAASHDRSQLASVNHGRPANAAMSRPRAAEANHAAANHAEANHAAANHAAANHGAANHAAENRSAEHKAAPANKAAEHKAAPAKSGGENKGGQAKGNNKGAAKPAAHQGKPAGEKK
jgi:hypothetical protein